MTPDPPRPEVNIKCKQDHRQYKYPKNNMSKEIKTTVGYTHNNNQIPILMLTLRFVWVLKARQRHNKKNVLDPHQMVASWACGRLDCIRIVLACGPVAEKKEKERERERGGREVKERVDYVESASSVSSKLYWVTAVTYHMSFELRKCIELKTRLQRKYEWWHMHINRVLNQIWKYKTNNNLVKMYNYAAIQFDI